MQGPSGTEREMPSGAEVFQLESGMKQLLLSIGSLQQSVVSLEASLTAHAQVVQGLDLGGSTLPPPNGMPNGMPNLPGMPNRLPVPLSLHEHQPSSFESDDEQAEQPPPLLRRSSGRSSSIQSVGKASMAFEDFVERNGKMPQNIHDLLDDNATRALKASRKRELMPAILPEEPAERRKKKVELSPRSQHPLKRRMSLQDLRLNTDADLAERPRTQQTETDTVNRETSALPCLGRILLCLVGHMRFCEGLASRILAIFFYFIYPMASTVPLMFMIHELDIALVLALCLFQLGISAASHSLEQNGLSVLLGPKERQLDELALEANFIDDWRRVSWRRLGEMVGIYGGMWMLRVAIAVVTGWETEQPGALALTFAEHVYGVVYWSMIGRYLLLCYVILHCTSGMELALDSFGLRFFKDGC